MLCPVGSKTNHPCTRVADTEPKGRAHGGRTVCEVHAALVPLEDEVEDLGIAEDLLGSWEGMAREVGNAPLETALRHAKEQMTQRLEVLETSVSAVHTTQR